jgi:hypothetical protein
MSCVEDASLLRFSWETPYGEANRLAAANGLVGRVHVKGLSYDRSSERVRFLQYCTATFEVVGQLERFHRVLLGTTGLGVGVHESRGVDDFKHRVAERLELLYGEELAASPPSPNLRSLSELLKR